MNIVRRGLRLVPLTATVVLGASVPAWAAFDDMVTVPTTITAVTGYVTC